MKDSMSKKKTNQTKNVDAVDLEIIELERGFALSLRGEILLTPEGAPIQHAAAPLLEHMVSEFDGNGTVKIQNSKIVAPRFFGSYALFNIQKAYVEPGKDDLSLDFANR